MLSLGKVVGSVSHQKTNKPFWGCLFGCGGRATSEGGNQTFKGMQGCELLRKTEVSEITLIEREEAESVRRSD